MANLDSERPTVIARISPADYECPACGFSTRWDLITVDSESGHNPSIVLQCDCGIGELKIIVE